MSLVHTIQRIRPIVFQVMAHMTVDGIFKVVPIGTAFAGTDDGRLITALHVVIGAEKLASEHGAQIFYGFAGPDVTTSAVKIRANFTLKTGKVIKRDELNDLAVVKLDVEKLADMRFSVQLGKELIEAVPEPCILVTELLDAGEMIACSGYPLSEPSLVTTAGHLASNWSLIEGQERYLGDITVNPGNSGGPVYLAKTGKVIGVCVANKLTNAVNREGGPSELWHAAGLTVIVPAPAVVEILK